MKRALLAIAILVGSATLALSRPPRPAMACTGPGPIETMLSSTVVIEGHVTAVVPDGPPGFDRAPFKLTFEVTRAHKGARAGDSIVARGYVPIPGKPIMCPQF